MEMVRSLALVVLCIVLLQGAGVASVYGNACCHWVLQITKDVDSNGWHRLDDGEPCWYHEEAWTALLAPGEVYCTLDTHDVRCTLCGHVHHVRLCGKYQSFCAKETGHAVCGKPQSHTGTADQCHVRCDCGCMDTGVTHD